MKREAFGSVWQTWMSDQLLLFQRRKIYNAGA
jgi:hypothetical protein